MSRTQRDYWLRKARFEIYVLGRKVEVVDLSDGDKVTGKWADTGRRHLSPGLVEDFLNYPSDPAAILRFTRRYGPLRVNTSGTDTWRFRLEDWRLEQRTLQGLWDGIGGRITPSIGGPQVKTSSTPTEPDELIRFSPTEGVVSYEVETLGRFLFLNLMTFPANRLKKCARPIEEGCPTPYFFANHLRQEYCSGPCAGWGKTKAKREWWHRRVAEQKGGRKK